MWAYFGYACIHHVLGHDPYPIGGLTCQLSMILVSKDFARSNYLSLFRIVCISKRRAWNPGYLSHNPAGIFSWYMRIRVRKTLHHPNHTMVEHELLWFRCEVVMNVVLTRRSLPARWRASHWIMIEHVEDSKMICKLVAAVEFAWMQLQLSSFTWIDLHGLPFAVPVSISEVQV